MKKLLVKIISYIDRNYNLLINKPKCVKLILQNDFKYQYNDVITKDGNVKLRCLGNSYFLMQQLWKQN